jgi:hypothetical protein
MKESDRYIKINSLMHSLGDILQEKEGASEKGNGDLYLVWSESLSVPI